MESRRQKPVDAMNRVWLGIGTDLKRLIVVAVACRFHWHPPSAGDTGAQRLSARRAEKQRGADSGRATLCNREKPGSRGSVGCVRRLSPYDHRSRTFVE